MRRRAEGVGSVRGVEVESPMGPTAVVVAGVGQQDSLEVPSAANERPVQALASGRSFGIASRGGSRKGRELGPCGDLWGAFIGLHL